VCFVCVVSLPFPSFPSLPFLVWCVFSRELSCSELRGRRDKQSQSPNIEGLSAERQRRQSKKKRPLAKRF
jgi:hypothetical protein